MNHPEKASMGSLVDGSRPHHPTMKEHELEGKETLIKNVSIFNGTSGKLITGKDVVLNGNKIAKLVPAGKDDSAYGTVIDGKKGYLTPGLIDAHWHCVLALPAGALVSTPTQYVAVLAAWEAKKLLMKGLPAPKPPSTAQ
jgi:imidazolonepropionase-like amidohydrolase